MQYTIKTWDGVEHEVGIYLNDKKYDLYDEYTWTVIISNDEEGIIYETDKATCDERYTLRLQETGYVRIGGQLTRTLPTKKSVRKKLRAIIEQYRDGRIEA